MNNTIYIQIILAILFAVSVGLFFYQPWKESSKYYWILVSLRSLTITILILLILNPMITSYRSIKQNPKLALLIDNSESIPLGKRDHLLQNSLALIENNNDLKKKFDIVKYSFGSSLSIYDSLDFKEDQTKIDKSLETLNEIFDSEIYPTILISDGNETTVKPVLSNQFINKKPVYPIILGDSISNSDLKIQNLNANKKTQIGNKFPVEIFLNYDGKQNIKTDLKIYKENSLVLKQSIGFSSNQNTKSLIFYLNAKTIGLNRYKAVIEPFGGEEFTDNNSKDFVINVEDNAVNVAFVFNKSHPDIGAISSIINGMKNHKVFYLSPKEFLNESVNYNIALIYDPDFGFNDVLAKIKKKNTNSLIFSENISDLNFLKLFDNSKLINKSLDKMDYQAITNPNFDLFSIDNISFRGYPPLKSTSVDLNFKDDLNILLYKKLYGSDTLEPLLFTYNIDGTKNVMFLAEDIWKWRIFCFKKNQSFVQFDSYFHSIFQYLSGSNSNLVTFHPYLFDGSEPIEINSQYFGKDLDLDLTSNLKIKIIAEQGNNIYNYPMTVNKNFYTVNLDGLPAGVYSYRVFNDDGKDSKEGKFEISKFNIESRFLNINYGKLKQLAYQTNGKCYHHSDISFLIKNLIDNEDYETIQKVEKKSLPLIEFYFLIIILLLSITSEWLIRKNNGLI